MTFITNHTFSNLLLRPPGLQAQGPPPDEKDYKAFGASMAKENGYTNQKGYELYDTTGGAEDWTLLRDRRLRLHVRDRPPRVPRRLRRRRGRRVQRHVARRRATAAATAPPT